MSSKQLNGRPTKVDWPYDHTPARRTPADILREERPPVTLAGLAHAAKIVIGALVYIAVVLTLVLLALGKASAAEHSTWLVANVASYHPDRAYASEHNLTGFNPGLGIEYALRDDVRLVGGAYRNSYRHASVYVAVSYQPIEILGARVGVLAGGVNGYPIHEGRFGPFAAAVASFEVRRVGVNVAYLPKVRDKAHGAIALQLKWGL